MYFCGVTFLKVLLLLLLLLLLTVARWLMYEATSHTEFECSSKSGSGYYPLLFLFLLLLSYVHSSHLNFSNHFFFFFILTIAINTGPYPCSSQRHSGQHHPPNRDHLFSRQKRSCYRFQPGTPPQPLAFYLCFALFFASKRLHVYHHSFHCVSFQVFSSSSCYFRGRPRIGRGGRLCIDRVASWTAMDSKASDIMLRCVHGVLCVGVAVT